MFVAAVLVYIVVKESNIPYVLAAYIAEVTLFLICIKGFQLPFPFISSIFLHFLWRNKPLNIDTKEEKRGEGLGFAVCLFIILIAYWGERGKNIRTILILYTCETVVFLVAIKIFHLNYPALPLAGLGGTIVLGAGIYKGLEKLFAFVNARVEQEISEIKIEERDKIQDYIRGILVTAGLVIAVTLIGVIMIPFIIKMYKMLKGKYYVFVPTCYWICFTLFIVCQSNSLLEGESIYEWRFGIMTGISLLLSTILMSLKK